MMHFEASVNESEDVFLGFFLTWTCMFKGLYLFFLGTCIRLGMAEDD